MKPIVGVFKSVEETRAALSALAERGIRREHITVLTPQSTRTELAAVPASDTEGRGLGPALAGSIGGALGLGAGFVLFLPVAGPVTALGFLAAALTGSVGAGIGGLAGAAFEEALSEGGVPTDDLYVYEDALRQGRTVIIVTDPEGSRADLEDARIALLQSGAESIDAARESWWTGVRDAERSAYEGGADGFDQDEEEFRLGFETALLLSLRDQNYEEAIGELEARHPEFYRRPGFRRGFLRGQQHLREREGEATGR